MAVTGFWPVFKNLKATLDYADNPDKTTAPEYLDEDLYAALRYAENDDKTDRKMFVGGINCSTQNAYAEMIAVQRRFGLRGKVVGYHGIQSFKEGEVTPEQAFEIGKATARRMWGDKYQVLVTVHLNTDNIHCHFVVNPVSFKDGSKFQNKIGDHKELRRVSDQICREHGLSVIQNPQDKTVTYDKWQGNQRRFTHRDELRMIIDAVLRMQPDGFDALMQLLEDAGCRIKRGAHISIKLPEGKRYIRLDTLGSEYDETSLRRTLAHDHVHIPKIPRGDFNGSQVKRLIDIETKLHAGKGKGYQVWAERNNIDAKAQMVIFLKEHQIDSLEELNDQIQELTNQQKELKAALREKQNRMKEINRQRQTIRDYSRTKEVYTQYRESGWSVKFYQEHRQEIEDHRNAQAVYSSLDGKIPTLKELTAEYDGLKERKENDQAALDELKPKLTDLKHIRYNYEILERDSAPNSHQHVIPKDHHYDEHGADHDDESR